MCEVSCWEQNAGKVSVEGAARGKVVVGRGWWWCGEGKGKGVVTSKRGDGGQSKGEGEAGVCKGVSSSAHSVPRGV